MQGAWLLTAALMGLPAAPVWAQFGVREPGTALGSALRGWNIVPTLSVEETYTDNVSLAPEGSRRSEWITQVRPGVSVNRSGARLRLTASYAAEGLYYANSGNSNVNHQLNAIGTAELVQQLLFLDASASVSQQNASLLGPQAESNINTTGNRTTVRTFLVSPYLRRDFGSNAQGEARLTYSSVTAGSEAATSLSDSQSNRIDLRLASGPAFRLLTWNVAYSKEHVGYSQGETQDVDTERISAGARRLITPNLGVRANVGYEDNNYVTAGPAPKGKFWSVGPEWTPTPRTRLAATTGRHYFGATQSLDFSHRTRLTTWRLGYSEDVTTTRQQLLIPTNVDTAGFLDALFLSGIPDPVVRRQAVQAFITQTGLPPSLRVPLNFFTNAPFLQKRLQASFGIQGVRNTVLANVFKTSSEVTASGQPGAGDFSASNMTRQTGGSVLWTLRMSAQTTSNVSVGYTRNEIPGLGREDDVTSVHLSLTRQFQPKVSGSLNYRRLQSDSNQSGASYTENAVSAALSMRF